MKSILILPGERSGITEMLIQRPVALLPALGKTFLEHWLEQLVLLGAREVTVLATDRPDQVRNFVSDGARWGLRIEVVPEMRELLADEARTKYGSASETWLPQPNDIIVADHFPGLAALRPLNSCAAWYESIQAMLARRAFPNYIGLKEVQPNVWAGRNSRISDTAIIKAPCWIGENASIGDNVHIGPLTVIEDGVVVDANATVSSSVVGTETYVGLGTEIHECLAFGRNLISWRTGSSVTVPERFLLSELRQPHLVEGMTTLFSRVVALLMLGLTMPVAACIAIRSWLQGQPAFRLRNAARAGHSHGTRAVLYRELLNTNRWWRRWPQLWNVWKGDFAWVGNRPLTPIQAGKLTTDFDKLWLSSTTGIFSLPDAEGCREGLDEEARAHATFFSVRQTRRMRRAILRRTVPRAVFAPQPPQEQMFAIPVAERAIKHQVQL